jgi:hypothetical protein
VNSSISTGSALAFAVRGGWADVSVATIAVPAVIAAATPKMGARNSLEAGIAGLMQRKGLHRYSPLVRQRLQQRESLARSNQSQRAYRYDCDSKRLMRVLRR